MRKTAGCERGCRRAAPRVRRCRTLLASWISSLISSIVMQLLRLSVPVGQISDLPSFPPQPSGTISFRPCPTRPPPSPCAICGRFTMAKPAVDGLSLTVPRGSFLRLPRPQRRGQIHHHPHAHRPDPRHIRHHRTARACRCPPRNWQSSSASAWCRTNRCFSTASPAREFLEFVGRMYSLDRRLAPPARR